MNIKEFNRMGFTSPDSGNRWDFNYAFGKIFRRSKIENMPDFGFHSPVMGNWEDVDVKTSFAVMTTSQWGKSPDVGLRTIDNVPLHITCNEDFTNPFINGGIDYVIPPKNSKLRLQIGDDDEVGVLMIDFSIGELSDEQIRAIYRWLISHIIKIAIDRYLNNTIYETLR